MVEFKKFTREPDVCSDFSAEDAKKCQEYRASYDREFRKLEDKHAKLTAETSESNLGSNDLKACLYRYEDEIWRTYKSIKGETHDKWDYDLYLDSDDRLTLISQRKKPEVGQLKLQQLGHPASK